MSLETRVWARGATRADDVLIETVNHHDPEPAARQPMRRDARLWIVGPKFRPSRTRLTFLPDEQPLAYRPHKQRIIREVRHHVHDADWCYGRPKSTTGFAKDLPPLWNNIARTDTYSQPAIGTPEQSEHDGTKSPEYLWLLAHAEDHPLDTLTLLHEHQADATLLTEELADKIDAAKADPTIQPIGLTDPPVVRRIEWEREQAMNGPVTKFYLVAGPGGEDDVTWYQRRGTPEPEQSFLMEHMTRVLTYAKDHNIRWFNAALLRDEYIGRRQMYGPEWMYSLLKPGTLRKFFNRDTTLGRVTNDLFWEIRQPDTSDIYREDQTQWDDDLHRPEPAYRVSRRPEIAEAQWRLEAFNERDPYYFEQDRFGKWRLHQEFVDLLAAESFNINSVTAIGWDDTIPLRENEKRYVVGGRDRSGKKIPDWYERWSTNRVRNYRLAGAEEPFDTQPWDIVEGTDNLGPCTSEGCRECRWHERRMAFRAELQAIIGRHKRKRAS